MKELHIARPGLVKDRTAAKNRDAACREPLLKITSHSGSLRSNGRSSLSMRL